MDMTDNVPTGRELVEALKVLWVRGKATVREIYQEMKPPDGEGDLAYTIVLSSLQTMEQKWLVGHEPAGKVYAYPTSIGSVPMARL
jgi:BlaI family penicillinase repressor